MPNPSAQMLRDLGILAVAEAAALLAADAEIGDLLLDNVQIVGRRR
ncbi:hypothetical protein [Thiocapsa sp. C2-2m]